jgi:hypothetical protein
MKSLNAKWLNTNEELAYSEIIRCTKKDQVRNLGRYLDKVTYKLLHKIE